VGWPTFCINNAAIIEFEQETTSGIFDVDEIVDQQLDIFVDIGGFIAVKTQSGRHDERFVVICSQFLYKRYNARTEKDANR
jgi:hypothetical protein